MTLLALLLVGTSGSRAEELYVPHLAVGGSAGGLHATTVLYLSNQSAVSSGGEIDFFDDVGNSLELLINGQGPTASITWSLEPGETVRLSVSAGGQLRTGWLRIQRQSSAVKIVAAFSIFSGELLDSWVGVPVAAETTVAFDIFFDTTDNRDAGLALVNPGSRSAHLTVSLLGPANAILKKLDREIGPGGHLAEMLGLSFASVQGAQETVSRVQVRSDEPLSGMTLMLDGSKLTFLPILPVEADTTVPTPAMVLQ